jgi:hypothetical protein
VDENDEIKQIRNALNTINVKTHLCIDYYERALLWGVHVLNTKHKAIVVFQDIGCSLTIPVQAWEQ